MKTQLQDSAIAAVLKSPVLMGIVNVTPNSFSDGGQFGSPRGGFDPAAATQYAIGLVEQGAAILDIGGEASSFFRPGVVPIAPEEQIRRIIPVVAGIAERHLTVPETGARVLISVDTRSAVVARAAIDAGAHIINDISSGQFDPRMLQAAAQLSVPIILMHMRDESAGKPEPYEDVCAAVRSYLRERIAAAIAAGVPARPDRIWLDPGIGFGKTLEDNWKLIAHLDCLVGMGYPVVLGASRKRFLTLTDTSNWPAPLPSPSRPDWHERDASTAVVTALAASRGVLVHRVHNVIENHRALAIATRSMKTGSTPCGS